MTTFKTQSQSNNQVDEIIEELSKTELGKDKREAMAILSIGTFLEYFDLFLYIHMAIILNNVFFPTTDPKSASLLGAFAFCSSFVFRPFGAIIFGYIGDIWWEEELLFFSQLESWPALV